MAEEAVSHPEADATATASSSSSSAPQMTSAWEGYIYAAFWSIMNRGSQLTAALQTAAQAHGHLNGYCYPGIEVVSNATSAVGTQNTTNGATPPSGNSSPTDATTEATEDEGAKLERSESYDSLGSFIASRRTVASGSSSKVSQPVNNDTTSWSAYLSGFVWSNAKAAKASSSSTKVEKTD
ncbi:hypothetical protein BX666DRAFT_1875770 [Dichotomocladium elegans]|nr:hypothetical protein BX666DRAFT_1875770 [Dichotomocladium elegans]